METIHFLIHFGTKLYIILRHATLTQINATKNWVHRISTERLWMTKDKETSLLVYDQTIRGMSRVRGREQMREGQKSPSTFPLSPFIGEVRTVVFIISSGGACIDKRASKGYKWVLDLSGKPLGYVIGTWTHYWGPKHIIHPNSSPLAIQFWSKVQDPIIEYKV